MDVHQDQIKVVIKKLNTNAAIPTRASDLAAGYDLKACFDSEVKELTLRPNQRLAIPTGLSFQIPPGWLISVRPRSGLAIKHGLTLVNSPGTIDADYRGEIKVLMVNLGSEDYSIKHHDRIAQVLLEKSYTIGFIENEILSDTARSEGGFGSTGRN